MKCKGKLQAIVVVLAICLSFVLPAQAASAPTTDDKADILNKLTILVGDNTDYNLDGQLKRSEAAAFIVRIMGKEKYVMENKSKYSRTSFSDVESNGWYAPYIGYCEENDIIHGIGGGKFGPDASISEKAFLTLALCAIGYEVGTDFNWDTVYTKAYDAGLVTGMAYVEKTGDNNSYTRGDVVKVLYNTLKKENRQTGVTTIQNLVDSGAVTRDIAVQEGFITDALVTAVESVAVSDANRISIKLNEGIDTLSASDIRIYETGNTASELTFTIASQSGDSLVLTTSAQAPERNYTVELSNVKDTEGNTVGPITGAFTGYKSSEIISDFFRISKVVPVSKSVINVFFTQPVNMNAELPLYYEIMQDNGSFVKGSFQNMAIKVISQYDNAVQIMLKDKLMLEGAPYTLKLSGDLPDVYGLKLNDGSGDSMSFTGKGTENEGFYVVNVMPVDKKTISVEFNKEVDLSSAQQTTNYSITYSNNYANSVIKAALVGDGEKKNKVVMLKLPSDLDSTKSYELTVKNVYDNYRLMQISGDTKYPFPGVSNARTDLQIINVVAEDKSRLAVYFDRPLDPSSAVTTGWYSVSGTGAPTTVYFDPEQPYMVKLFFGGTPFNGSNNYTLMVQTMMQDYLGNMSASPAQFNFSGASTDIFKPVIYEAKIVAKNAIRIRTSEEVQALGSNVLASNYWLEYTSGSTTTKVNASGVSYIDATTLIVKFDTLDFSKNYTLKFNTLSSYTGGNTRTSADGLTSVPVSLGQ